MRLAIPNHLKRGGVRDDRSVSLGLDALKTVAAILGGDLSVFRDKSMLDVGCGHKQAEAIIAHQIPLRRYVGLDNHQQLVEALSLATEGTALEFRHIDVFNTRYWRHGVPLSRETCLPIGDERFDMIHAWSLFSHLPAEDIDAFFHILRRHAHANSTFFLTAFISSSVREWKDENPERPLLRVFYNPWFLDQLLSVAGWRVVRCFSYTDDGAECWPVQSLEGLVYAPAGVIQALTRTGGQSCLIAEPV